MPKFKRQRNLQVKRGGHLTSLQSDQVDSIMERVGPDGRASTKLAEEYGITLKGLRKYDALLIEYHISNL